MFKNVLGNYTISISPEQAQTLLDLLQTKDVYTMTTGEYLSFAVLQNKLEEIVDDNKIS